MHSFLQSTAVVCAATVLTTTVGVRLLAKGPERVGTNLTVRTQRLELIDSEGRTALLFNSEQPEVYWIDPGLGVPEGATATLRFADILGDDASQMLVGLAAPFRHNADLRIQTPGMASPARVSMVLAGGPQSPEVFLMRQKGDDGNLVLLRGFAEHRLRIFDPEKGTVAFER